MSDSTILIALRHNTWADLELLGFCSKLTQEQMAWSTGGTYGSILMTLRHLIRAEEGYLLALTSEEPPLGLLSLKGPAPSLEELSLRAGTSGERLERVLASPSFDPSRIVTHRTGTKAAAGVVAAQFIHHGSDHRAHVGTILGAHGRETPEIDVWAYASRAGQATEPPAARR